MNWKCPACGSDDNEENSLRCTCGYDNERSVLGGGQKQREDMHVTHRERMETPRQKHVNIKFYLFMSFAAFALYYDKWYQHHKNANLIKASILLMLWGIPHWGFNEFIYHKYKDSANSKPKYLRIFALTPDRDILKLLGIISSGVGFILFLCFYF